MSKKIILLVDDEIEILKSLRPPLKESGFEVITAADGEDALNMALTQKPDLMVLDLKMPKVDGYGVLIELRQRKAEIQEQAPHIKSYKIPIIILTAYGDERVRELLKKEEIAAFLEKPIEPEQLITEIKKVLD